MEFHYNFDGQNQDLDLAFYYEDLESRYFASLDRLGEAFEASFYQNYRLCDSWDSNVEPEIVQSLCWEEDFSQKDEFLTEEEISKKSNFRPLPIGTKPRKVEPPQEAPPTLRENKPKPQLPQKPMEIGYWLGVPITPKSILKKHRNNHHWRNGRQARRSHRSRRNGKKNLKVSFKEEIDFIKSKYY
jgi:hypothetical protein